jgi:hypothetical protein
MTLMTGRLCIRLHLWSRLVAALSMHARPVRMRVIRVGDLDSGTLVSAGLCRVSSVAWRGCHALSLIDSLAYLEHATVVAVIV